MDQFESIQIDTGIFESEDVRKGNRKRQMNKRKQKILKGTNGILKNKDPLIKVEKVDERDRKERPRKQVSISEQPRLGGSPGIKNDSRNNKLNRNLKRNQSDEKSQNSLQIGQNPKSDLTVSSAGKHPDLEDDNSIISEEDSAFEDQTPAAKKSKANNNADFSLA